MMKKEKSQTIKRLKLLMVLPVISLLVFAFAERKVVNEEREFPKPEKLKIETKATLDLVQRQDDLAKVVGAIFDENGATLANTYIFSLEAREGNIHPYQNTSALLKSGNYSMTDEQGKFSIEIPRKDNAGLVIARLGYYTKFGVFGNPPEAYEVSKKLKKGIYHLSIPSGTYFSVPHDYENKEMLKNIPGEWLKRHNETMIVIEGLPKYKEGGASGLANSIQQSTSKYATVEGTGSGERTTVGGPGGREGTTEKGDVGGCRRTRRSQEYPEGT